MKICKACGLQFYTTNPAKELCHCCEEALKRLNGYAVPVVRCKECIHWCDCKVRLADGTYRDYLPGEAFGNVTLDIGINVGSHCTLHGCEGSSVTWFWARPDDFCSRGEKRNDA